MTSAELLPIGLRPLANNPDNLRICHVRAVESDNVAGRGDSIQNVLDLGRLGRGMSSADVLAPHVGAVATNNELALTGQRWKPTTKCEWQRLRVVSAGGGVVDVRMLSMPWDSLKSTIDLLEDLHYESLGGEPSDWEETHVEGCEGPTDSTLPFHQLVFVPTSEPEPDWELIQRLIYRVDLDAIEEYSSIRHPDELNRRPGQLAAVSRFGSVLYGLQDYVEASLVISAALTVAAAGSARRVRRIAYENLFEVRQLADIDQRVLDQKREPLKQLKIDLALQAEAHASIDHLLPSLRVESFHQALFSAADVQGQIELAGRMVDRATDVIGSD